MSENSILFHGCIWAYFLIGAICAAAILRRAQKGVDLHRGFPYPSMAKLVAVLILWLPLMAVGAVMEVVKYFRSKPKNP